MKTQTEQKTMVEDLMEKFEALGWMISYTVDGNGVPNALLAGKHEVIEDMKKYLPQFIDIDLDRDTLN